MKKFATEKKQIKGWKDFWVMRECANLVNLKLWKLKKYKIKIQAGSFNQQWLKSWQTSQSMNQLSSLYQVTWVTGEMTEQISRLTQQRKGRQQTEPTQQEKLVRWNTSMTTMNLRCCWERRSWRWKLERWNMNESKAPEGWSIITEWV